MSPLEHTLGDLSRRLGLDPARPSAQSRAVLESTLLPMIRVALRSGLGPTPLVQWVRSQLPDLWPTDPARSARWLAQALSDRLLERCSPLAARETIVGT